ncbi:FtsX-like permease family protein, partial [Faecalibacterium hattorii]|uniref:FtsX-like permease family protein n=1 Tax=Faecalibacterium hattorii TaxID=2935520 RepID=UPI003AAD65D4
LSGEEQVLEFEDQLQQIELLVNLKQVADPLLGYAETALNNAQKALDEAEPADEEYTELRDALAKAQAAYDNISGQLNGYQQQLDAGKQQMYAQGLISSPSLSNTELVTEAKAALRKMKLQLLQGQLQLSTGTAAATSAFAAAQQQLADARTQLDDGWAEYDSGKEQLEASRTEYETQKAEAQQKLADGQKQIDDAEEQISDIQSGTWYVLDRGSTMSFASFEQYADRMDAIARVFPVFFFLVAALVASTTMTRMVDENRLQMGTLKALGYSNTMIAGKYLLYGLAASVSGSIFGMVVGFIVFPTIIWQAYQTMMFQIPTFSLQFYPGMAAGSVLLSAAVIGIATWESCRASLKEKTAALLLPRAPVAGKRILLEYITPLWKHMSFSQKTTARNLFRYKKRFFMTVLGVAGCTALLLIGFGIQDSILPMLTKQTTELNHSDLTISLSDEKAFTVENGVIDVLDASADVTSFGRFYTKSVTLYNADGDQQTISLVAAEDESQMTDYFTFRTRQGHKAISFDDSSVILTEKTAELLGLAVGDSFEVELSDGSRQTLTLTGITENYVFTRLYLSQTQLKRLTGGTLPAWNTLYAQTSCPDTDARNALRTDLLACNYVGSVSFIEDTTEMFDNLIGCLNYVVILVIVCAAALAAVVLYNLISVNLGERKKELATIKVLGFYDKEVYRYIFREIDLLALIGSLVGLALGVPLHQFIIRTVEMDQMMFIRAAAPRSYLFSVALTLFFTVIVCRLMRRHIKKISMVESMKAPE